MICKMMLGIMEVMTRLQQRLGRDAADVEARSAEGSTHVDAGRAEAQVGGCDGGDVASGTAADDYGVVWLLGGGGGGEVG